MFQPHAHQASHCGRMRQQSLPTAGSTELYRTAGRPNSRVFGLDVVLSASIRVLLQLVGGWLWGEER